MPTALTGNPSDHAPSGILIGSCLCGSITVTIRDSELFTRRRGHLCHCQNCRKTSGSYVSSNLLIEREKVTIEDRGGTLKSFDDMGTSGKPVHRYFCGWDGNPIKSEPESLPSEKVILKMGIMPRIPQPEFDGFASHRHDWECGIPGVEAYKVKWNGPDREPLDA